MDPVDLVLDLIVEAVRPTYALCSFILMPTLRYVFSIPSKFMEKLSKIKETTSSVLPLQDMLSTSRLEGTTVDNVDRVIAEKKIDFYPYTSDFTIATPNGSQPLNIPNLVGKTCRPKDFYIQIPELLRKNPSTEDREKTRTRRATLSHSKSLSNISSLKDIDSEYGSPSLCGKFLPTPSQLTWTGEDSLDGFAYNHHVRQLHPNRYVDDEHNHEYSYYDRGPPQKIMHNGRVYVKGPRKRSYTDDKNINLDKKPHSKRYTDDGPSHRDKGPPPKRYPVDRPVVDKGSASKRRTSLKEYVDHRPTHQVEVHPPKRYFDDRPVVDKGYSSRYFDDEPKRVDKGHSPKHYADDGPTHHYQASSSKHWVSLRDYINHKPPHVIKEPDKKKPVDDKSTNKNKNANKLPNDGTSSRNVVTDEKPNNSAVPNMLRSIPNQGRRETTMSRGAYDKDFYVEYDEDYYYYYQKPPRRYTTYSYNQDARPRKSTSWTRSASFDSLPRPSSSVRRASSSSIPNQETKGMIRRQSSYVEDFFYLEYDGDYYYYFHKPPRRYATYNQEARPRKSTPWKDSAPVKLLPKSVPRQFRSRRRTVSDSSIWPTANLNHQNSKEI